MYILNKSTKKSLASLQVIFVGHFVCLYGMNPEINFQQAIAHSENKILRVSKMRSDLSAPVQCVQQTGMFPAKIPNKLDRIETLREACAFYLHSLAVCLFVKSFR